MENNEDKPKSGPGVWRGPEHLANRKGRLPGSKNKNTALIREAYQKLTEDNLLNMSLWIQQIAADNPEKAFKLMLEMSEFVLPKLNRTELTGNNGDDLFKSLKFEFGPSVQERLDSLDAIEDIEIDD
tara:strand:- start:654 stop:1034 length:381 start_codon:yes stop_codon:yes gene_type:complete